MPIGEILVQLLEQRSVPRLLPWPTLIVDRRVMLAGQPGRPIAERMERLCAALGTGAVWEPGEGRLVLQLR